MGFSLSLPIVGQPHSTEDPKVGNDLTTISTWANGNIVDTDLNSPNNSYRRLLINGWGSLFGSAAAATYVLTGTGLQTPTSINSYFPVWSGDAGYSGQPQDFQVANKSSFARLRASVLTNATAPAVTFVFAVAPITAVAGGSGLFNLTLGANLGTATVTTPGPGQFNGATSTQFSLPTSVGSYVLTVTTNASPPAASASALNCALFGYSA